MPGFDEDEDGLIKNSKNQKNTGADKHIKFTVPQESLKFEIFNAWR